MSSKKQPEQIVFFIDRCLGKQEVPAALKKAGADIRIHDDHFKQAAPDEEWLIEVGKEGWVVLTRDKKIRFVSPQRIAIENTKLRMFTLTARNLRGADMAEAFVKALPRIERVAKANPGPFIAKVYRKGEVKMWWTPKRERRKKTRSKKSRKPRS